MGNELLKATFITISERVITLLLEEHLANTLPIASGPMRESPAHNLDVLTTTCECFADTSNERIVGDGHAPTTLESSEGESSPAHEEGEGIENLP